MIGKIQTKRLLLKLALFTIPLGYLAGEVGWIVAEVGRQPWAIQGMLPTSLATSHLSDNSVIITLALFTTLFTALLIAEIKIMLTQIKLGVEGEQ
jgi:cytochrome d ubiquinol oxidase subunit I